MNKTASTILQDRSFLYIIFFGSVIVLIVVSLIIMQQKSIDGTVSKIAGRKAELEKQKILHPFFEQLEKTYQKEMNENLDVLSLPERKPLTNEDEKDLELDLDETAEKNGLILKSYQPDIKSFFDDSKRLVVNIVITGEVAKFRDMMIDLLKLPYLEDIQSIIIERDKENGGVVLKLTLFLLKA